MTVSYPQVRDWVEAFSSTVSENRDYLTRLDSAIGDADHGTNMDRGMKAVLGKLNGLEDEDIGAMLKTVGMTLVSTVGGAAGPLYGTLRSTQRSRASKCEGRRSRATKRCSTP